MVWENERGAQGGKEGGQRKTIKLFNFYTTNSIDNFTVSKRILFTVIITFYVTSGVDVHRR